ncbi:Acyl-CoA N-acyltransferase with RING/FYVE/PHD-type zinc finger domain-containing protein [Hirschfeldia incana]|nr:Acyl-CoA N-acyltransferase with RING/FYVE/PHD-type zinc finger domain-containing protein [Hirschfeldia incana]
MGEEEEGTVSLERVELKRERLCNEGEESPSKKQAKEPSNDDIVSEISNPVSSPVENTSRFRANNPVKSPVECNEEFGSEETVSDEASVVAGSPPPPAEQFVLEIPKHLSSTGVTRIKFKLSKQKKEFEDLPVVKDDHHHAWEEEEKLLPKKKVVTASSSSYPSNVKKLLATGMLDGAPVKYISLSRVRELQGVIHSGGYLCGCTNCNFSKQRVLSAYEFEQHAGAKTKHPNNHIFLENGRAVYSIVQELKNARQDTLEDVIRSVAGSALCEEGLQAWKARFQQSNSISDGSRIMEHSPVSYNGHSHDGTQNLTPCSLTTYSLESHYYREKTYETDALYEPKRIAKKKLTSHVSGGCHKKATEGSNRKRDNDLHRLVFMPNGLPDGTELAYYVKTQKLLAGFKQGNGIVCSCCNKEISPSQFEAHAGMAGRRQPYRHIFISSGLSLHDIALSLANGQVITTGDSDDMCSVCGDGGDLLLCAGCPQAFHTACLKFQSMPEGTWYCSSCSDGSLSSKKVTATGPPGNSKSILLRLSRVVKAQESDIGGCVFCRSHDFSIGVFDERTVILCDQCEKEYHVGCLRENGLCDLKEIPQEKWFCCNGCSRIHTAVQSSVSCGPQSIPAPLSDMIRRKDREKGIITEDGDLVEWRILSGKSRYPEHLPLLSRAAVIFRECFDPIVAKSGRDLIPVMVYGRNISGQEFGGMYCLVLIVNSLVVSAALLRIFGQQVAELPMVATSREYQGRGYFQGLFACVENLLSSLNVENLVLPAAEEAESIWTNKFGFTKMTEQQLQNYQKEVQLTVFKGTSMLEKKVPKSLSESTTLI